MGGLDKTIRFVLAAVIAILYFTHTISGTVSIVLSILAVIFALTSLISFCPLYVPLGINTCKKENK